MERPNHRQTVFPVAPALGAGRGRQHRRARARSPAHRARGRPHQGRRAPTPVGRPREPRPARRPGYAAGDRRGQRRRRRARAAARPGDRRRQDGPQDRGGAHPRADPARRGRGHFWPGDQRQPRRYPAHDRSLQDAALLRHRLRGRRLRPLHHLLQRAARAVGEPVRPLPQAELRRDLLLVRQRLRVAAQDERGGPHRGGGRRRPGRGRRVHPLRRQGLHQHGAQDRAVGGHGTGARRGGGGRHHLRETVRRRRRKDQNQAGLARLQRELHPGPDQGRIRGHRDRRQLYQHVTQARGPGLRGQGQEALWRPRHREQYGGRSLHASPLLHRGRPARRCGG